jgi:peptidoglycan/xylan/chitin deacetylase (PgdA/CDA1 family)
MWIPFTAALGVAGLASYASVAPTSQLWGRTIAHVPHCKIALTYDDGPNDGTTQELLGILADAKVHATFFLIGRYVRQQAALVREIVDAGHTLGNHTDTHANLLWASPACVREELSRCQQAIEDAAGVRAKWFRPPWGMRRPDTLRIAREGGLTPVLWNVTCFDWRGGITAEQVLAHARRQMQRNDARGRGSVVLLHDGGHLALGADRTASLAATRFMLQQYSRESFLSL